MTCVAQAGEAWHRRRKPLSHQSWPLGSGPLRVATDVTRLPPATKTKWQGCFHLGVGESRSEARRGCLEQPPSQRQCGMAVTLEPFTISLGRAKWHRRIRSDYDKGAELRRGQGGAVAGELVVPARPLICLAGRWGHMRLCTAAGAHRPDVCARTRTHTHRDRHAHTHACAHRSIMHTHMHSQRSIMHTHAHMHARTETDHAHTYMHA